jgi:hypothetical protein
MYNHGLYLQADRVKILVQDKNLSFIYMYLEKDKVKGLIDNAMKGLQASGRIENTSRSYMTPQPTNVPSVPIDAESQVNLDQIQNMIEK